MESEFKYDVAISFLYGDLELAKKLHDELAPQFRVFLSAERQGELGGQDGVDCFTTVFRREARVVVVLYRKEWGTTPWTRIEETAIKDRWLNAGSEFLLVVNLEPSDAKPVWLPDTKLWMRLTAAWHLSDVVAAVTLKAREAGAVPQRLTAHDLAMREQRKIEESQVRERKLSSEGLTAGAAQVQMLFDSIDRITNVVNAGAPNVQVTVRKAPDIRVLRRGRESIIIAWNARYANTDLGSTLITGEWDGPVGLPGEVFAGSRQPRKTREIRYAFDYMAELGWCWRDIGSGEYLSTEDLADRLVQRTIENSLRLGKKQRPDKGSDQDDAFF